MKKIYISELSKLVGISKRTLHHYDDIGLLKPSLGVGISNGYRLYSDKDLLKLKQIIALKIFGFKLSSIKDILDSNIDLYPIFKKQIELLEKKAKASSEVINLLRELIDNYDINKNLSWEQILERVERSKHILFNKKT